MIKENILMSEAELPEMVREYAYAVPEWILQVSQPSNQRVQEWLSEKEHIVPYNTSTKPAAEFSFTGSFPDYNSALAAYREFKESYKGNGDITLNVVQKKDFSGVTICVIATKPK